MSSGDVVAVIVIIILAAYILFSSGMIYSGDAAATDAGSIINTTPADEEIMNRISEAVDYENPSTRDFAVSSVEHGGNYNIAQICDIWENIHEQWTYVNDPVGIEYPSPASRTILLGLKGDCDDYAIVTAAAIEAIGGASRIIYTSDHAYPEVAIAKSRSQFENHENYICERYGCNKVYYHIDKSEGETYYWLNLDSTATHPGGPYHDPWGEYKVVYPR